MPCTELGCTFSQVPLASKWVRQCDTILILDTYWIKAKVEEWSLLDLF